VTIKVNDESLYDLLPPKMDSQFIRPPKVPEGGNSSHKIFSAGVISRRSSSLAPPARAVLRVEVM